MIATPKPTAEAERLEALAAYGILDTEAEQAFDDLAMLAARVCETPIAFVNFLDEERLWVKARVGLDLGECPREEAVCSHTILESEPFVVPDLAADSRFAQSRFMVDDPKLRFYAGAPLITSSGMVVGTICALDLAPKQLRGEQREALAALARHVVAQLELRRLASHREQLAVTDALTGLGNRHKLFGDLERALEQDAVEPRVLAIFDLDGFKLYNDSYGHPAGDALLTRLAAQLREVVAPHGEAYRVGGDEFCILVDALGARDALVDKASQALRLSGEGFSVGSSHGQVRLPDEVDDVGGALQLADERMFQHKHARSEVANRQTHDVLVRILNEREPELLAHVRGVAAMAGEVGERLGMDGEEINELVRAAELHDIGKVAIPDAILHKPGSLTVDEWAFMKSHPVLGERILAAAPSLRAIGKLIRSTHERWDGRGYPDGLAGEEIPLGSRIIFACDALNAMTSPRSYRETLSRADALEEIRRGAGAQFDAVVVDVLCGEVLAEEPLEDAAVAS